MNKRNLWQATGQLQKPERIRNPGLPMPAKTRICRAEKPARKYFLRGTDMALRCEV